MTLTTFMAFAGGVPTFVSIGCFLFVVLFLSSKKGVSFKTIKVCKLASKIAHRNHCTIKEELINAKPLVKFRFRLLVGSRRYKDYIYQA
jgi:hypothetical protein